MIQGSNNNNSHLEQTVRKLLVIIMTAIKWNQHLQQNLSISKEMTITLLMKTKIIPFSIPQDKMLRKDNRVRRMLMPLALLAPEKSKR